LIRNPIIKLPEQLFTADFTVPMAIGITEKITDFII